MNPFRNCLFSVRHDRDLAVFVRSTGEYDICDLDYPSIHKRAAFAEIFWPIEGYGIFHFRDKKYRVAPRHIWYYPCGSDHYFYPGSDHFHYCWLTLQGADADAFFRTLAIKPGVSPAGVCPQHLFQKLATQITGLKKENFLQMLSTAFQILTLAAAGSTAPAQKNDYLENVKAVIEDDFSNTQLTVEQLAANFHIHRVTLSRAFSARYHTTIRDYINRCRIRAAVELLQTTDLPVTDIAEQCGFSSSGYFSKVIVKATGLPPGKHRETR